MTGVKSKKRAAPKTRKPSSTSSKRTTATRTTRKSRPVPKKAVASRPVSAPGAKRYTPASTRSSPITQFTPYYTQSQLSKMDKERLLKICKSSRILRCKDKSPAQLREMILSRQSKATRTSKYVWMSMEQLKQHAEEENVSTSGTKQDIMDRLHKKRKMV